MSNSEQYRAGFEAWARGKWPGLSLDGESLQFGWHYYDDVARDWWKVWTAAKSEASTEPSSTSTSQGAALDAMRDKLRTVVYAASAVIERWESPKWKDEAPTADYIARLRAAVNEASANSNSGAAPGDALDAAKPKAIPFCVMLHSDGTMTDLTQAISKCGCQACNPHMIGRQMFICPNCGDKRCPHASNHESKCSAIATTTSKRSHDAN